MARRWRNSCDCLLIKFYSVGSITTLKLPITLVGMSSPLTCLARPLAHIPSVANFSKDVSDGENYTVLLHQLSSDCSLSPLQTKDLHQRAEQVLQNANKLNCRKFLTPNSLVAGNPKLNLAFVANLFNNHPGLAPLEEVDVPEIEDFDAEGEREARVFTLWLNSLDVEPGVYNLFEDLKVSCALATGSVN